VLKNNHHADPTGAIITSIGMMGVFPTSSTGIWLVSVSSRFSNQLGRGNLTFTIIKTSRLYNFGSITVQHMVETNGDVWFWRLYIRSFYGEESRIYCLMFSA
jgi:hypothetical protein